MRNLIELVLLGASVGLGNFAAALAVGLSGVSSALRIKITAIFGLFETVMPIVGLVLGKRLASVFGNHANLIGGGLLILTGLYELMSIRDKADETEVKRAESGWLKLLIAGLALSLDNLVIGFSLGTRGQSIILSAVVIGLTSVVLVLLGLELGKRLSRKFEKYSELLSGVILLLVGLAVMLKLI